MSGNPSSATVYLNPRFKNIHINPNFIIQPVVDEERTHKIHVNPNFIAKSNVSGNVPKIPQETPLVCTRNKLVRSVRPASSCPVIVSTVPATTLRKIGLRKLVRKTTPSREFSLPGASQPPRDCESKFKVIRTVTGGDLRPKVISTRFRLKRSSSFSDVLTPKKVIASKYRLRRIGYSAKKESPKDALKLCDINGVLYKSAVRQQLFRAPQQTRGSALYIRGERFLVTGNGNRLQRAPEKAVTSSKSEPPRKRIDIGGVTFVANDKGTFERTNSHIVRSYLSHAKQKSLNILSAASQFKKTNVPCVIYRRLGKCRSHERGKCNKLHNPDQVAVCSKFLKGLCTNTDCLLSHKVCLTKMPVCRFFLDGCCTTAECPYLHKKVSETAEVCVDFQRGFCPLADKCPNRHEHEKVAPRKRPMNREIRTTKETLSTSTAGQDAKQQQEEEGRYYKKETQADDRPTPPEIELNGGREKEEEESEDEPEDLIVPKRRPPIGTLPAFIPL